MMCMYQCDSRLTDDDVIVYVVEIALKKNIPTLLKKSTALSKSFQPTPNSS